MHKMWSVPYFLVAGIVRQVPENKIIRNSGHQGGDFVFQRR